jgi:hypothetical protein
MRFTLYGGAFSQTQVSLGDTWELVLTGFTTQPSDVSGCLSSEATFSVAAAGTGPFTYQWRHNGLPLDVIRNPTAAMPMLTVSDAGEGDAGSYDCIVTNACGSATSNAATLTVCRCVTCAADFNEDGGVDGADVNAFFASWEAGNCDADVNQDGGVDGEDVGAFFVEWEAGGC